MSTLFEIKKGYLEINKSHKDRVAQGVVCSNDENAQVLTSFNSLDEAKKYFEDNHFFTDISFRSGKFYEINEYWIEENTYDEEGEWCEGGDVWEISKFPISPAELKKLGLMEIDADDISHLDQNLYIHTDKFEDWLDENFNDELSFRNQLKSWHFEMYVHELSSQFDKAKGYNFNYNDNDTIRINQCFTLPASKTKSHKDEIFAYSVILYPTSWNDELNRWNYDKVFDLTPNEEYKKQLTNKSQKQKNDFVR